MIIKKYYFLKNISMRFTIAAGNGYLRREAEMG